MSRRLLIDINQVIDYALAIILALASSEVKLEGLTAIHDHCLSNVAWSMLRQYWIWQKPAISRWTKAAIVLSSSLR